MASFPSDKPGRPANPLKPSPPVCSSLPLLGTSVPQQQQKQQHKQQHKQQQHKQQQQLQRAVAETAQKAAAAGETQFLALRYPNIHVRALSGFVHHFPASHAQFTAHIIKQVNAGETKSVGRDGRRLTWENDQKRQNDKIGPRATRLVETKAETSQAALRGDSRLTEGARCGSQIARCA
ncbi:hypothetical protein Esti_006408 [Eimeria stiedai]